MSSYMKVYREEKVILWPYTGAMEIELETYLEGDGFLDRFSIEMGGDFLPEGENGHVDEAAFNINLTELEARKLWNTLGEWLKGRDLSERHANRSS